LLVVFLQLSVIFFLGLSFVKKEKRVTIEKTET
jgi:hypothetical protein